MTNTKARKLTDRQREVLGVLRAKPYARLTCNFRTHNWELYTDTSVSARIHNATGNSLNHHGYLKYLNSSELRCHREYTITPAGRDILSFDPEGSQTLNGNEVKERQG